MHAIKKTLLCITFASVFAANTNAQSANENASTYNKNKWKASFGIQSDLHYATSKKHEGKRFMGNSYINGTLHNNIWEFGLRVEEANNPLPGREEEKGWGIANIYAKARIKGFEFTIGDIYEQFGSGMLLRSYEDRTLGIDNSIRGGRITVSAINGVILKAIAGQHRNYFDRGWKPFNADRGYLGGLDADLDLSNIISKLSENQWAIQLGGSYVLKHEKPNNNITKTENGQRFRLYQPENISAWTTRLRVQHGAFDINSEYAYKYSDPSENNKYTFGHGTVAMLNATYAQKGLSALIGARRSENFDFRSERTALQTSMRVNHLLPFTQQQTYSLSALYPYATRPEGEWAFQAELRYRFKRGSLLGGKYGTSIKLSASYVRELKKEVTEGIGSIEDSSIDLRGTNGYNTKFFGMGKQLFHDIDLEISKKLSRSYQFTFSYMNQHYNQKVIEGHADNGDVIYSNIFVYEGKHKLSEEMGIRTELQYLTTKQAEKDWLYGLIEFSPTPDIIFSISDQWNVGVTKKHYYMFSIAGTFSGHRLQLSYGSTREGINCSGGVCRVMPASKGLFLSYNFIL